MDADGLLKRCDDLSTSVALGPGLHNAIFAMPEASETIAFLRREIPAKDIQHELLEIEKLFERWFTLGDWRGHDQGQSFQQDLYSKISRLKTSIRLWHTALSAAYQDNPRSS